MKPVAFGLATAECLVFTYKAGLLAGVAHDLKLRAERFEIAIDDEGIRAQFDAASLRVVCAQAGGKDIREEAGIPQRDRTLRPVEREGVPEHEHVHQHVFIS